MVALGAGKSSTMTLVDGTTLTASRGESEQVDPRLLAVSADELDQCSDCFFVDEPGDITRVRVSTSLSQGDEVHTMGVVLEHQGSAPVRIRWDVLLIGQI